MDSCRLRRTGVSIMRNTLVDAMVFIFVVVICIFVFLDAKFSVFFPLLVITSPKYR